MQVPTVTLEDLQAFQAAHFPGPHAPLHATSTAPIAEEDLDAGEDDLGYYPDGVKRTLTDEQIRIFRHSEIHALLRQRQLERDEAEYQSRARKLFEDDIAATTQADVHQEEIDSCEKDSGHAGPDLNQRRLSPTGAKSRKRANRETKDESSPTLDYEDLEQGTARKSRPVESRAPFAGRRIISYDD